MGWQTIGYRLVIDDEAGPEDDRYTIESESEYSGGHVLVSTRDPDEVEAWIEDRAGGGV